MKQRTLILSLAVNAALVAAIVVFTRRQDTPAVQPEPTVTEAPATPATPVTAPVQEAPVVTRPSNFNWRQVESTDYATYIKNLRSIGCPEETIRDIIMADVDQFYTAQYEKMFPSSREIFWQTRQQRGSDPAVAAARQQARELDRQKFALVQQLLGVDFKSEIRKYLGGDAGDARLDFLTPEKRKQILAVRERYVELAEDVVAEFGRVIFPDDIERLRQLHAERRNTLLGILTPDELSTLESRASHSADVLGPRMAGVAVTPEEFRDIVQLRRPLDEEFDLLEALPYYQLNAAEQARKQAAFARLEQQIREKLGEARYADYKRAQDRSFQLLFEITQRNQLPTQAAESAYAIVFNALKRKEQLRTATTSNTNALKTLQTDTEQRLRAILGEAGLNDFNVESGAWLANLAKP